MSVDLMADRYAVALCDLAPDDELDSLIGNLEALQQVFEPVMDSVFSNPEVSRKQRLELIDRVFEDIDADRLQRFCRLLVEKNRFQNFDSIVEGIRRESNRRLNRTPARVKTAFSLGDDQKEELIRQLGEVVGTDVILDQELEESLIAGLQVELGDYLITYSIEQRLLELEERFTAQSV